MRVFGLIIWLTFTPFGADCEIPSSERSNAAIERASAKLSHDLMDQNLRLGNRLFLQITKIPAELNAYVEAQDGTYRLFRTYPICKYSGGLGPKKQQGDGKSPEGFYRVRADQMNPASSYHLSFNLGYPNAYDRAHGYTGNYLMVHGRCVSIGCYAMTDAAMDEIWTLVDAAFRSGQDEIPVHIFPFKMNWPARYTYSTHSDSHFWKSLEPAWLSFAKTKKPPDTSVASGQYIITVDQP